MPTEVDDPTPRIMPSSTEALSPDQRKLLEGAAELMGFTPNDALTMARVPGLLEASAALVGAVFGGGLDPEVRRLVSIMSSEAAGCRYCRAHTHHGALREGVGPDRLAEIWSFESSTAFTQAQKAAMRVAHGAALAPNQVEEEHFRALSEHFSETEQLEIVAVISLFGFLNRWNDTLKTQIEPEPEAALANNPTEA